MAIVENPTKNTALRVGKLPEGKFDYNDLDEKPPSPSTDDYPITAGPIPVPDDLSAELADVLLDANTYVKSQPNFCDPEPGVRLTFDSNAGRVDVFLCFECDILVVHRDGKRIHRDFCDFARPALLRAAKRLFPEDEAIQGLPEKADGKSG